MTETIENRLKLERGKFYWTRDGQKVEILQTVSDDDEYPYLVYIAGEVETYTENGILVEEGDLNNWDLVAEWKEPIRHTRKLYANLYPDGDIHVWHHKDDADSASSGLDILECREITIEWEEK